MTILQVFAEPISLILLQDGTGITENAVSTIYSIAPTLPRTLPEKPADLLLCIS
jgi:hypothetical protein